MSKRHSLLGLILLTAYVWQSMQGMDWVWMQQLQAGFVYKQASGFVLLWFILEQWRLFFIRSQNRLREAHQRLKKHRYLGLMAPIFIFSHATVMGYGYQVMLSGCYLLSACVGFLYPSTFGLRHKWLTASWLVVHVGLSTFLLVLLGVHVYVVYLYE